MTFGVYVSNLFDNFRGQPVVNQAICKSVATGQAGLQTGQIRKRLSGQFRWDAECRSTSPAAAMQSIYDEYWLPFQRLVRARPSRTACTRSSNSKRSTKRRTMIRFDRYAFALLAACGLTACTAGSTGAPPIAQVNPGNPTYSKLQFAVGTANLYGNGVGLNVVSTLRQPNGESATGVNTPKIAGPFTFSAANAPAVGTNAPLLRESVLDEYAFGSLYDRRRRRTEHRRNDRRRRTSAARRKRSCRERRTATTRARCPRTPTERHLHERPAGYTPDASTFGQSGGVFALGLAPFNHQAATGQAASYAPYPQPFYDAGLTQSAPQSARPPLVPWGGPPAFDPDGNGMGTRDGLFPAGTDSFNQNYFLGVTEGITAFAGVVPRTGNYTLAVTIGTLGSGGSQNVTTLAQSATLRTSRRYPL